MTLSPDTDSRAEIQSLLDATPSGGTLDLPAGSYFVTRAGSAYYALRVPAGVRVRGNGTTIRQAPGIGASVRTFQMDGAGATLENLTGDGDAANQTVDEHRAFAFVAAADCTLRGVTAHDFTGDGIYVYTGADRALVENCTATGNRRNGITIAGGTGVRVYGGAFAGNAAQQVDSEPGSPTHVDDVTIADALIDSGTVAGFALTISGSSSASRSRGWRVTGCTIRGGVHVVWADDVIIAGNDIANGVSKFGIDAYRSCDGLTIARNTIAMTNAAMGFASAVAAVGTGGSSRPTNVNVVDNVITCAAPSSLGLRFDGCGSVTAVGNRMVGAGIVNAGGAAIYARATDPSVPFDLATFVGNVAAGFGSKGLAIQGNGASQLTRVRAVGNTFGDATAVQTVGISLDDGTHALQASNIVGNAYGAGVTSGAL